MFSSCEYDYIEIYDGEDWNAPKLGTWCGSGDIPTLLSTSNMLYIEFISDESGKAEGFKLKYEFFADRTSEFNNREVIFLLH